MSLFPTLYDPFDMALVDLTLAFNVDRTMWQMERFWAQVAIAALLDALSSAADFASQEWGNPITKWDGFFEG